MSGVDIKARRKRLGLEQTDLAALAGVSTGTLYRIEEEGLAVDADAAQRIERELKRLERAEGVA